MLKEFHMRVIHKAEEGPFKATVRGRNQFGEFIVDFYIDGEVNPDARYFTDDKMDAVGTADAWVGGVDLGPIMVGAIVGGKVHLAVVGGAEAAAFVDGA